MEKPAYKIRLEDFIPFEGLNRHGVRCGKDKAIMEFVYGVDKDKYDMRAVRRAIGLFIYNGVLGIGGLTGIVVGSKKLLEWTLWN